MSPDDGQRLGGKRADFIDELGPAFNRHVEPVASERVAFLEELVGKHLKDAE